MSFLVNKYALALAIALAILIGLGWGIRQYGSKRVQEDRASASAAVVAGARIDQKAALSTDIKQEQSKAVLTQHVRDVARMNKEKSNAVPKASAVPDAVGDAERLRLLNDAIESANASISAATEGLH